MLTLFQTASTQLLIYCRQESIIIINFTHEIAHNDTSNTGLKRVIVCKVDQRGGWTYNEDKYVFTNVVVELVKAGASFRKTFALELPHNDISSTVV